MTFRRKASDGGLTLSSCGTRIGERLLSAFLIKAKGRSCIIQDPPFEMHWNPPAILLLDGLHLWTTSIRKIYRSHDANSMSKKMKRLSEIRGGFEQCEKIPSLKLHIGFDTPSISTSIVIEYFSPNTLSFSSKSLFEEKSIDKNFDKGCSLFGLNEQMIATLLIRALLNPRFAKEIFLPQAYFCDKILSFTLAVRTNPN